MRKNLDFPEECGGDVGSGEVAEGGELDDDALLAGHTGHSATDPFEHAVGHFYFVVAFEVDEVGILHQQEVLVLRLGHLNEVEHLVWGDGQGRVLACGRLGEVVVVITEYGREARAGGGVGRVGIADEDVGIVGTDVGEEDVGNHVLQHPLGVTIHVFPLIVAGHIYIVPCANHVVGCQIFSSIRCSEDEPRFCWVRGIGYRHPRMFVFCFWDGCGGKPAAGVFFRYANITQCIHIGLFLCRGSACPSVS